MLRRIYYFLSPNGRKFVRRIYYFPRDVFELLFLKRNKLVPSKGKSFVGRGDFEQIGDTFLNHITETCQINNNSKILDIGSGIGRIARPFTNFLSLDGEYIGFDIIPDGVNWCKKAYSDFPNFKFDYFPLYNDLYNLDAVKKSAEFKFPYQQSYFDLAISISVFTHLQKDELVNYFAQINSVLKPGGKFYATFFFVDKQTNNHLFPFDFGDYALHNTKVTNAIVAYKKEFIEKIAAESGLEIRSFYYGWWRNGLANESVDFQDIVIFEKSI